MSWTNYHSHTHYCDGSNPVPDYLAEAERLGFLAYGYSSHAPLPYPSSKWAVKEADLSRYLSEVNALKGSSPVQVYTSMEIDFVPGVAGPGSEVVKNANLDYTLASVHFVDFFEDGRPWEIDGAKVYFDEGLHAIWNGDLRAVVERYFELTRQMVREDCPDIIGHLDKIKIQNYHAPRFDEQADWYQKALNDTLDEVIASGAIVEVNTRGLYKKCSRETYPGPYALRRLQRAGVRLMLNSDCHHPAEVAGEFEAAARMLLGLGVKELTVFLDGEFYQAEFDEKGLKLKRRS